MTEWKVINSDYFPVVDLGAERARFIGQGATGLRLLNSGLLDFTSPFLGRRTAFRSDPRYVIPAHERLAMLSRGATVRAAFEQDRTPAVEIDHDTESILDRVWQWKNWILADRPPPHWDVWARQTVQIEADLHQGTAGVVDERFYESLHAYLERHPPPPRVCATVTFLEAIRRWDFGAAAGPGASLVEEAVAKRSLIPAHQLLAGAVTAALATGDRAAASRYVEQLSAALPSDLWMKLLDSYTRRSDRLPPPPVGQVGALSWRCPGREA
jgi:hypothetical protein